LNRLPNPHPDTNFLARFTQPEFTSLCLANAQPDFAQLAIDYAPDQFIVE
jgi:7-cyano-7-deazaguanine reductase